MRLCAIDQSWTDSGVSLYLEGEEKYFSITSKEEKGKYRLKVLQNEFRKVIVDNRLEVVLIEDYAYGATYRTHMSGELGGMLKLLCYDMRIPCIVMPIGEHKKFSTGKGNTKKDMMLKEVYKNYGVDVDNDNIADSISILKTYLGYLAYKGGSKEFTKVQESVMLEIEGRVTEAFELIN